MLDSIQVFFRRRAAKRLKKRLASVWIRVQHSGETQRGDFPFPGRHTHLLIESNRQPVGHIDYLVNALRDRVYINKIEIASEHQRQGHGLAVL